MCFWSSGLTSSIGLTTSPEKDNRTVFLFDGWGISLSTSLNLLKFENLHKIGIPTLQEGNQLRFSFCGQASRFLLRHGWIFCLFIFGSNFWQRIISRCFIFTGCLKGWLSSLNFARHLLNSDSVVLISIRNIANGNNNIRNYPPAIFFSSININCLCFLRFMSVNTLVMYFGWYLCRYR